MIPDVCFDSDVMPHGVAHPYRWLHVLLKNAPDLIGRLQICPVYLAQGRTANKKCSSLPTPSTKVAISFFSSRPAVGGRAHANWSRFSLNVRNSIIVGLTRNPPQFLVLVPVGYQYDFVPCQTAGVIPFPKQGVGFACSSMLSFGHLGSGSASSHPPQR